MASSRLVRWTVTLSDYSYKLIHRPGRNNNADALSRLSLPNCPQEVSVPNDVLFVLNILDTTSVNVAFVVEDKLQDGIPSIALSFTFSGWPKKIHNDR